ncbi:hypothetical protein ACES2L_09985 [Bdellovibrio bacteriovorus]
MFSKRKWSLKTASLLTVAMMGLSACDSKVGEAPPPPQSQEFGGTDCLTEAKPVIKAFVLGDAKNDELETTWVCIDSAIEKFKRYVRGRSADRYTPQELATFLENNFLAKSEDPPISPALQAEFMKVKLLFLGGSPNYISRAELDKILVLTKSLREITIKLNPYMKVLSLNWSVTEANNIQRDVKYFEDANREVQNAARTLAALIEKNGQTYKLSDFVFLMEEMGTFFKEKWEFPKVIARYMPVVKKVKKALAGGQENSITPNEWRRFALLGARGYVQFLRYHYFIKSAPETGTGYRLSYLSRTVEDVLSVFQDLVAEKPEEVVSREEVTDLLKTLEIVWPEFKVSPGLVLEGMKVKALFFGGSVDSFSSRDFETARLKVSRIKVLVERFLPFYTIYGREWDPGFYEPEEAQRLFMESQFVLEATVREAGSLFEGTYDINDLTSLIREVESLYPGFAARDLSDKMKPYIPLVIDAKNMIFGGNDSSLRKGHWSTLLGFASRVYTDFLYYDYFLSGKDLEQPLSVSYMSILANQSLNILRDLLAAKKTTNFSALELRILIKHLGKVGLIPDKLSDAAADGFVDVLVNNILVFPEQRIKGTLPNALTMSSVEVLRQEAQVWLDTELFISKVVQNWKPEEGLSTADLISLLQKEKAQLNDTVPLYSGLHEIQLAVQGPVTHTVDEKGRLIISNRFEQLYTAKSLRQLNMNRSLARILIRSVSKDLEAIKTYKGATLEEIQEPFRKVFPALVDLGFVDKKSVNFVKSRFLEANLFTPHADGNSFASQAELSTLVGMIWSGVRINNMLRETLIAECFNGRQITNSDSVSIACAQKAYRKAMPTVMTATPEYLKFQKHASLEDWSVFMTNAFKAAGYEPNDKKEALIEDIALTPHVLQYIESVFARYDKNKDGYIETSEGLKAYPAFKGIIMDVAKEQLDAGKLKASELQPLFMYILRYGKAPDGLAEGACFRYIWVKKPEKWNIWAGRSKMAEILGYIADQSRKGKKPASQSNIGLKLACDWLN